jgi:hypothetical protein
MPCPGSTLGKNATADGRYATDGIKRWLLVYCPCGCERTPFQVFANASPAKAGNLQYKMQPHAECYANAREGHKAKAAAEGKRASTFTRNMSVMRDSLDEDTEGQRARDKSRPFFIDHQTGQAYRQTP